MYRKSAARMRALFSDLPQAVDNSLRVAERCEFSLEDLGYRFPDYPVPAGETAFSYLHKLVHAGARWRYRPLEPRHASQIARELALIAKLDLDRLTQLLHKASRHRLGPADARRIQATAARSCGLTQALDAYQLHIQMLVEQLRHLEKQVNVLDTQIQAILSQQAQQAAEEGPPSESILAHQVQRLQTISGIGQTLGPQILAEVGEVGRLEGPDPAKQVVALAGIDPKVRTSGKFKGHVKMSKRGSPYLRDALMQAAFGAVFNKQDPMFTAIYARQKARGKHHWIALSHVANKMARVVYAVLKNDRAYVPIL